jgi:hypothetical protein
VLKKLAAKRKSSVLANASPTHCLKIKFVAFIK